MDTLTPHPQIPRRRLLAHPVHTAILIVILLGVSYISAGNGPVAVEKIGRLSFYLRTISWELLLVLYVWWGIRKRNGRIRELIGGRWASIGDLARDVGIAAVFWMISAVVLVSLGTLLGFTHPAEAEEMRRRVGFLVPRRPIELMTWVLLSINAGICEEILFRGYLQRQFTGMTSRAWLGVLLQGILFGASHAYEGRERMLLIAVYGILFGILALLRKSTRPGMIAHALQDTLAGFAGRFIS